MFCAKKKHIMLQKFVFFLLFEIVWDIGSSAAQISSTCRDANKAVILLDSANDFISRAKSSFPICLFFPPNSMYTLCHSEGDKSSTLLETATTLISSAKNTFTTRSQDVKYKLICYLSAVAYNRRGEGKFELTAFDPHMCTHAIYNRADLKGNRIESNDPNIDLPTYLNGYKKFNDLKQLNENLKTLIAIGGESMGFSLMAADKTNRATFIESVLVFLKKYGFDGLDLNWEFPGSDGGRSEDKRNFVVLLQEMRAALKPRGFLLTSTVSAIKHVIDKAYDVPAISKELDQIHLLSYNFHGPWQDVTGINAPLYAALGASEEDKQLTVDFAVNYWLNSGAPKEKLVLGLPLFGRSFTLADAAKNGVLAPATGAGNKGRFNWYEAMLGFNEVCENLSKRRWAFVWDPDARTPYAYKENQWVGYDDEKSLDIKVDYLTKKGLAGGFVWSIDIDDHRGICYGKKWYLLRKVASKLFHGDEKNPF